MATTSPKLTLPFNLGAGSLLGQGNSPELWVLYTTDDASVSAPAWVTATSDVRAVSTSRGRDNELAEVDAGSCTITLDNRAGGYDPSAQPAIRPMNRWWVREQFTGETQDLFLGYAESYDQLWPEAGIGDEVAVVHCVDEFKVLNLKKLPTMSPPRDTYDDYVQADAPNTFFPFDGTALTVISGSLTGLDVTPIVGGKIGPFVAGSAGSARLASGGLATLDPSLAAGQGGAFFTVEFWFRPSTAASSGSTELLRGPLSTAAGNPPLWRILHTAGSGISFEVTNNSLTVSTVTSTGAGGTLTANAWHHIVGALDGTTLRLYINGTQNNTAAFSSVMLDAGALVAGTTFNIGNASATYTRDFAKMAIYFGKALAAASVASHYTTGLTRGYAAGDLPGARCQKVLDTVTSHAPRNLKAGVRAMQGVFMTGQPPLDELRRAAKADSVDGFVFTARDGTLTFLDAAHRSNSPYNTVQATFDDDGTALTYIDLGLDFSESFLANIWNVTKDGGVTATASDATSISRNFDRPQAITDLPITSDSDASAIASALLAKYKDAYQRITSITLTTSDPAVTEAVFRRDLGDRIRVRRTAHASGSSLFGVGIYGVGVFGGSKIDQTLFIQRISIDATPDGLWRVVWAVSPL